MKLLRWSIQGFRSFNGEQTLDLTGLRPGLYHVTGDNKVEPELEGNAAGKSSLFEAPYWLLYGRTSRGLKAGAVKHWTSKNQCGGFLEVEISPSDDLGIFRSWQPNNLEASLNGGPERPIEQAPLEGLLGMGPDAFLYAIYFAQFVPAFVDLKAAAQAQLFTQVLQLEVWDRAAEAARLRTVKNIEDLASLDLRIMRLKGQAEELLAQDFGAAADEWDAKQRQAIKNAQNELADAKARVAAAEKALVAAHKGAQAFRATRDVVEVLARDYSAAMALVARSENQIAQLRRKDLKECPTCGQPVNNKHLAKEIARTQIELETLNVQADKILAEHDALMRELANGPNRDAEIQYGRAEQEKGVASAIVGLATKALAQLRAERNPHLAAMQQAEQRGAQLVEELEELGRQQTKLEQEKAGTEYWIKGFREVRLSEIRGALDQLTVECNEVLFQLGLHDWAVSFDVERETKAGGVSSGFAVMVLPPGLNAPVPFEAYSGGESQRLRLAIAMGFSNLICARAGVAPNVELWDEPTTWVAPRGINDLLEVLAERAQRMNKVILLADHRAHAFGGFAGSIKVTKDRGGSRVEVSAV